MKKFAGVKMLSNLDYQYGSWSLRKQMFQEHWLMVLFSSNNVTLRPLSSPQHTRTPQQSTHLPWSLAGSCPSSINQVALESIENIKRLNLFRCLVLIAYYTIITHLVPHEAWERETHSPHPNTLHTALNQSHSKSAGLQLNRCCQRCWAFMRPASLWAQRNSTRTSKILRDKVYKILRDKVYLLLK